MFSIKKVKVLYVDDMKTFQVILKHILEALEIEDMTYAEDGTSALEIMENESKEWRPFDLVLCDWNLKILDGIDLLEKIRNHSDPLIKNVRFIMITGSDEKIRKAMEDGSDNFIAKPFTTEKLREKIEFLFRFSE